MAGLKIADFCFFNLKLGATEGFAPDCVGDGEEVADASMKPFQQEVSRDGDPTTFEDFLLPVDWEM